MKNKIYNVVCIDNTDTELKLNKIYKAKKSIFKKDCYIINYDNHAIHKYKYKFKELRDYRIDKLT